MATNIEINPYNELFNAFDTEILNLNEDIEKAKKNGNKDNLYEIGMSAFETALDNVRKNPLMKKFEEETTNDNANWWDDIRTMLIAEFVEK